MRKFVTVLASAAFAAGAVLPGLAMAASSTATGAPASSSVMKKKGVQMDMVCIQAAVDKRETDLAAGVESFVNGLRQAFAARKDALKAAWANSDKKERDSALKAAWSAFGQSSKKARSDWKAARQNAWKTFRTEMKTCKGGDGAAEQGGESVDGQM